LTTGRPFTALIGLEEGEDLDAVRPIDLVRTIAQHYGVPADDVELMGRWAERPRV
jgi:hypothetical protein